MATLWRCGPNAVSYSVSSKAEHNHLGADIAFVDRSTHRILLYQAKLAFFDGTDYQLKSKVTAAQAKLLSQKSITLDGSIFAITGRLALYQCDVAPFIWCCGDDEFFDYWFWRRWSSSANRFAPDPTIGRRYYESVLRRRCSPSGVIACGVRGKSAITSIPGNVVWPWEFDGFEWLQSTSPLDGSSLNTDLDLQSMTPEFSNYSPVLGDPPNIDDEYASRIAAALGLPVSQQLHVLVI